MPINPKLLAYQNILGTQPIDQPIDTTDPITAAYRQYLTSPADYSKLPTPENIVPQTVKNIKESHGIVPSILQGLGGILKLANTGIGQRSINQMLGGDVYTGAAREQMAQGQLGQESAMRGLVGQQELERQKALSQYGVEEMRKQADIEREKALRAEQEAFETEQNRLTREAMAPTRELERQKTQAEIEKMKTAPFEEKKKAIYEANKDIPGAEYILNAKNDQELSSISISKGFKIPFMGRIGAKVGGATPSTNPVLEKWGIK
jgi:hypothetical protein